MLFTHSVTYWHDGVTREVALPCWNDYPTEGVLWVDITEGKYHHRLQGFDNYWVDEATQSYGVFNDPANYAWYEGEQVVSWPVKSVCPADVHVLRGVLVPDEVAWDLGLLPRGEHLPPRPG